MCIKQMNTEESHGDDTEGTVITLFSCLGVQGFINAICCICKYSVQPCTSTLSRTHAKVLVMWLGLLSLVERHTKLPHFRENPASK